MIKLKKPRYKDIIWHYMDFTKFVTILDYSALFFSRVDLFDDTYEGLLPDLDKTIKHISQIIYEQGIKEDLKNPENCRDKNKHFISKEIEQSVKDSFDFFRKHTAANCWFKGDESAAMWKLYSSELTGVALKTTFKRLHDSFLYDINKLVFSEVTYISDSNDYLNSFNRIFNANKEKEENLDIAGLTGKIIEKAINPYFLKRNCFSAEKEVRAIIQKPVHHYDMTQDEIRSIWAEEVGEYIPVDVETLIDEVYVSPKAPEWFKNQVKSVLNQYGYFNLTSRVIKSDLYRNPLS